MSDCAVGYFNMDAVRVQANQQTRIISGVAICYMVGICIVSERNNLDIELEF